MGKKRKETTWRDTTTFSQSDKERVPRSFERIFGDFRLCVHRHIHYPPDTWLATCHPEIFMQRPLQAKTVADAQHEATLLLQQKLEAALAAITT